MAYLSYYKETHDQFNNNIRCIEIWPYYIMCLAR